MKDTSLQAAPAPALAATDAQRPTTVRWRIFLILLLLAAINYIDRASLSVALPLISAEFELTPAMEGLILSAFFWSYALMQIPSGMLLDRFRCATSSAPPPSAGAFQALAGGAHNWITLLITRVGLGGPNRRSCRPGPSSTAPG
ncbi:MFS transporter [Pseudomonas qingdaonensis]|nr:MFS transporter [Pseudomonas qingdaonensis]